MCMGGENTAALNVAQNLFASIGQHQNARAQYNAALAGNRMAKMKADDEANLRAANAYMNYTRIQEGQRETNVEAAGQKLENARAINKAKAVAALGAIEGGVGGSVVDRAMQDLGFTRNQKDAAIEATRQNELGQLESEKTAQWLAAQTSPTYIYTPDAPKFNPLGAIISGFSGFFTGGSAPVAKACGVTAPAAGACGTPRFANSGYYLGKVS